MSAPTAQSTPRDSIRCRYDTYGNGKQYDHERARRSFYKWVCKHEQFGNLRPRLRQHLYCPDIQYIVYEREPEKFNYGGLGYSRGYPSFDASRSLARDYWEREFDKHRELFEAMRDEEARKAMERRIALEAERDSRNAARTRAVERIYSMDDKSARRFFTIMHAASAIAQA